MATIAEMRDAIEEQLRDLMLAEAGLDAVKVFMRGYDPRPRIDFYPLVEVFTEERVTESEETGFITYAYQVHLGVSVLIADHTNPDEDNPRKADVGSYITTGALVACVKDLLLKHRDLDGVSFTDGDGNLERVWYIELGTDTAGVEQRQNNYANFGRISFRARTRQQRVTLIG